MSLSLKTRKKLAKFSLTNRVAALELLFVGERAHHYQFYGDGRQAYEDAQVTLLRMNHSVTNQSTITEMEAQNRANDELAARLERQSRESTGAKRRRSAQSVARRLRGRSKAALR